MTTVNGNDVTILAKIGEDWKPFICATDIEFLSNADLLPCSTRGDGFSSKFVYQKKNASINVSGIQTIGEDAASFQYFDALLQQQNFLSLEVAISFNSAGIEKFVKASVLFPSINITAGASDLSNMTLAMVVNGPFEITDAIACAAGIASAYYTGVGPLNGLVTMNANADTSYIVFEFIYGLGYFTYPIGTAYAPSPFVMPVSFLGTGTYLIRGTPYCSDDTAGEFFDIEIVIS